MKSWPKVGPNAFLPQILMHESARKPLKKGGCRRPHGYRHYYEKAIWALFCHVLSRPIKSVKSRKIALLNLIKSHQVSYRVGPKLAQIHAAETAVRYYYSHFHDM